MIWYNPAPHKRREMTATDFPYRRIGVIGATGSGKTTLARQLAGKLDLTHIELDALHWEAEWREAPDEVFRQRVELATQAPGWSTDGNYSKVRDIIWQRAEAVVWLDYSLSLVFWRLLRRTAQRCRTGEELWNGNRESWSSQLKLWSTDSLFNWLFQTYWRRKREYPQLFALPEHRHLNVFHFRFPNQTRSWLAEM
jgi:adenylate kinase family enzyme